jgi:multicomponent Na+:H+ antiporter subunit C
MTPPFLYALTGICLFALGLYALITHYNLLRKIIALNIMSSGVFLVLVALAGRSLDALPDPVPLAMVITGIVVTVSSTALALVLILKMQAVIVGPRLCNQIEDKKNKV